MKIKRQTKIISQTERKFSFAIKRKPISFFCTSCNAPSEMLSINEAAKKLKTGWRDIVSGIESGAFHSTETEAGEIYVCAASLSVNNQPKNY